MTAIETDVIEEGGVTYTLQRTTETNWRGEEISRLVISADIGRLRWITQEPGFLLDEPRVTWQAMNGDEIVFIDHSLYWLKKAIESYFRKQTRQEQLRYCKELANDLESRHRQLQSSGRPVTRLEELIQQAKRVLGKIEWDPYGTFGEVKTALNAAKNQLERVENSTVEVLIQELVDGHNGCQIHSVNQQVILWTEELEIRSGGTIAATSTDWLVQEWYPLVLDDVKTVPGMLGCSDLRVTLDSLVSPEERENPAIEWAPEVLEFTDKSGNVTSREVAYGYQQVDGERIATGCVRMKLSDYKRLGSLPRLSHDIRLFITVTVADEDVLYGEAGAKLDDKIARWEKGKRRSRTLAPVLDRSVAAEHGSTAPPWLKGKVRF